MTNKKKIVITGASSGLGKVYITHFLSYDVINISRTVSKSNYNIIVI